MAGLYTRWVYLQSQIPAACIFVGFPLVFTAFAMLSSTVVTHPLFVFY